MLNKHEHEHILCYYIVFIASLFLWIPSTWCSVPYISVVSHHIINV